MPLINGKDSKGYYYAFGSGKRYYYIAGDPETHEASKQKALKQGRAIERSKALRRMKYLF